jgi:hypothetical protein
VDELKAATTIIVFDYSMSETDAFFKYLTTLALSEKSISSITLIVVDTSDNREAKFRKRGDYCTVTATIAVCDRRRSADRRHCNRVAASRRSSGLPAATAAAAATTTHPAAKNIRTMRQSPATRRRRRDGIPSRKPPTSALPPAAIHPNPRGRCSEADILERTCGAVVETVSVAGPEPFATEFGLNEQEGAGVAERAIVLQDRFTLPLKPLIEVMVNVEVDDPPVEIVASESGVAPISKSYCARGDVQQYAQELAGLTARSSLPSPLKSATTSETPAFVPEL